MSLGLAAYRLLTALLEPLAPTALAGRARKGKEDPVVDCSSVKKRKAKIECMAKDRRVEVEFEFEK